jgi:hypothetical protein
MYSAMVGWLVWLRLEGFILIAFGVVQFTNQKVKRVKLSCNI